MTNINKKIFSMIVNNYSNDMICESLHITKTELKNRIQSIKNEGFNITKLYNYDGTQQYNFDKKCLESERIVSIEGELPGKGFRAIAIADTHIGNPKHNIGYINQIYDYSIKKDINIIFHAGDLLEGFIPNSMEPRDQLEFFIDKYPVDKNILTFLVFGNHEEHFLTKYGINLQTVITKYRDDIIPLGYGECPVKLSNIKDHIIMCHNHREFESNGIRLCGHSHRYRFFADDYNPQITIPTLSDYLHTCDFPGAVELYIEPCNEKVRYMMIRHIVISESGKIRTASQIEHKSGKIRMR